jgi:hypothetical protein
MQLCGRKGEMVAGAGSGADILDKKRLAMVALLCKKPGRYGNKALIA